jgi:hypothetical protein
MAFAALRITSSTACGWESIGTSKADIAERESNVRLPPKADMVQQGRDVRFVPETEVAVFRSMELIVQPDAKVAGEMGVGEGLSTSRSENNPAPFKIPHVTGRRTTGRRTFAALHTRRGNRIHSAS